LIEQGYENSCDVDHFFPDVLKQHDFQGIDQVWNLVLSCKDCNRGAGGKFERIADIKFLRRLHRRNNFFIDSHHPLKETIINQTGEKRKDREKFLQTFYHKAVDTIPSNSKWTPEEIVGEAF
jgi:hypothetical protein